MVQATSCPSAAVLQRLLFGQSAEEESVSLEAHLLECEKCLRVVQALPPHDALISSLQEGRDFATQAPRSELLEKLRLRLQEMPVSSLGSDTATAENTNPNAPTPSPEMMVDETVALQPPQQADEIGRLGGYRVLKELGRGGMGAVYQAEDPKLKRLVALKVMLPRLAADPSARRRFLREAQAMAAVHHDHVVTIYQVDEDNGVPFLAMEFLHGTPLDKWLKDGRKPNLTQTLRIGREIAEGLAAAHARGLIHRDIKPGNIWLDSDHKDRVKILDFGLARVGTDDVHLTRSGAIVGTPAYMSPEQGAGQKVDARTDLFSLGSVLYRFCTGAMPFAGDTTMALLTALAVADPKPVRDLNPETPAALADLVMRLLAKKPVDRPAKAQEVADQLAAIEQSPQGVQANKNDDGSRTEVLAPENRPSPRLAKPRSRRRTAIFALMAAAAALIVAAGAVVYVQTDRGTLEIKTADKDVKVIVEQDGAQVDVLDPQSKQQLSIHSGKYTLKLTGVDGEHEMVIDQGTNPVTLTRGGKVVVTVNRVEKPVVATAPAETTAKSAFPPLDEAWAKKVRDLPPEKQVEEVAAELTRRNPAFDGKVKPTIESGGVTALEFSTDTVVDISPVQALTGLRYLLCGGGSSAYSGRLADLSPLKGMKLTALICNNNAPLSDLSPLKEMPLTSFTCAYCAVSDLSPLKDMKLTFLSCGGDSRLSDLSPLKGMPLTSLTCIGTRVSDLSPLKDMKLTSLLCGGTQISDLSPLTGMELTVLDINGTRVTDLSPLKEMKLENLNCAGTKASDLSLLKGMPLKALGCDFVPERDTEILRSIKTLETINGKPAAEFWKDVAAKPTFPPLDEAWVKLVASLPAAAQVEAVAAKLKERNPGFDGKVTPAIADGAVTGLEMKTDDVADLTPLRALPGLNSLNFSGIDADKCRLSDLSTIKDLKLTGLYCHGTRVSDLSPLKDMKLTYLGCNFTQVSDLSPLKGMPLEQLNFAGTPVTDLSPLKDMPLKMMDWSSTQVSDLSPLKGMKLTNLQCGFTRVSDLSPLKDMPLEMLHFHRTKVTDLSPLKGMPLKNLLCDFIPERDTEILRSIKTLENINGKPAAEFWKDVAAKPTFPPLDEAWVKLVASLPAAAQVEAVAAKLKERNPGFDGKVTPLTFTGKVITGLKFISDEVTDLTPLQGLPELKTATFSASSAGKGRVTDLSPLKGMKLTELDCTGTQVTDLSPLKGMPLAYLNCSGTQVSDLSPLKGMPLTMLACSETRVADLSALRGIPLISLDCLLSPVSDLSPLKDMKLTHLNCSGTQVSGLSPLKGMPLEQLGCGNTQVSDLSPLKGAPLTSLDCNTLRVSDLSPLKDMKLTALDCHGTPVSDLLALKNMPLKELRCDFEAERDTEILRSIKTLETINGKPAAEFWKEVEAKAAEKKP